MSAALTSRCSRRATSSSTIAPATASRADLALALAKGVPVDARLPRVDVLVDQPARELFEAAIELPLDERGRHLERDARSELLHQRRANLPLGGVPRLVLEVLANARLQRIERLEVAEILGELVVQLGEHPPLDALHRHGIRDVGIRQLPNRVVGRVVRW